MTQAWLPLGTKVHVPWGGRSLMCSEFVIIGTLDASGRAVMYSFTKFPPWNTTQLVTADRFVRMHLPDKCSNTAEWNSPERGWDWIGVEW